MFVTVPPWHPVTGGLGNGGRPDKEKTAKNPVSHWRVSRRSVVGQCHAPSKPKFLRFNQSVRLYIQPRCQVRRRYFGRRMPKAHRRLSGAVRNHVVTWE